MLRVKIALGERIAKSLGVGYTAVSRVKHVRDVVFERDLPDYEVFQSAKHTRAFRSRRRFELRLEARASETLLMYASGLKDVTVQCEADPWESEDARLALALVSELRNVGTMRRNALRNSGRPSDEDAWLWEARPPNLAAELEQACEGVAQRLSVSTDECRKVADRLLQEVPVDVGGTRLVALHVPLVKEALGCLIPEDLHPRLDGRKPKQNAGALAASTALDLKCGSFRMKRCEERDLHEKRPLTKGLVEFFVHVLRCVGQCLRLAPSVYFGHVGLADSLGDEHSAAEFVQKLRDWASLGGESIRQAKRSQMLLLPVAYKRGREPEWSLMVVTGASPGEAVSDAKKIRYELLTVRKNEAFADRVAEKVDKLLGVDSSVRDGGVSLTEFGLVEEKRTSSTFVVVAMAVRLAGLAGVPVALPSQAWELLSAAQDCLTAAYESLKADADASMERDVLQCLRKGSSAKSLLNLLVTPAGPEPPPRK